MNLQDFPRVRLGHWPTPLEPMKGLAGRLNAARLFIKRDDCTGLATGGSKTRKLEFLVGEAMRQGADTLLTHGAVQSNHVRQTAAAAAFMGLACEAILEERVQDAPAAYHESGNVLLDQLFGIQLHRVPGGTAMDAALEALAQKLRQQGRKPYVIPGGGSNALGSLGYVDCVLELQRQCEAMGLRKPHLVHATGSAGTQAGLVAGIHALGLDWPVTGIGVRAPREAQETRVHDLAVRVLNLLGVTRPLPRERVVADDRFIGAGYGIPTDSMIEAVTLLARTEGILADPVYTGKGLAGLLEMVRTGRFHSDEDVIFVHTGGSAGLFGYVSAFAKASA
ncbi:D-cysteine desulfhydrase [Ideonella sp. A 288]|uniref:D-cysteine desulfhydrase n=1 Tax=Ideonella sp. A 288 TaxID=1962181 RepID=UPI000B4AB009|nr:D-cysteine desulfhydrase [Ideonella sp. A 288]